MSDKPYGLLQFSIEGLNNFRERYGFVAADDVLRAVTLMVRNAVTKHGSEQDFIGHIETETFLIITSPTALEDIQELIERRISQSREYFYPLRDRERAQQAMKENLLYVKSAVYTLKPHSHGNLEALRQTLHEVITKVE
jgi:GGDEF domain-containing protein